MTIKEARHIFERNGYEFTYAKIWREYFEENEHQFLTHKDHKNICREGVVGDKSIKYALEHLIENVKLQDQTFRTVFKEDIVTKILQIYE